MLQSEEQPGEAPGEHPLPQHIHSLMPGTQIKLYVKCIFYFLVVGGGSKKVCLYSRHTYLYVREKSIMTQSCINDMETCSMTYFIFSSG